MRIGPVAQVQQARKSLPVRVLAARWRWLRTYPYSPFQKVVFRFPGGTFTYHPVPKNGCTSVKWILAEALGLTDRYAYGGDVPNYKKAPVRPGDKPNIHALLKSEKFRGRWGDYRICVVRDPVERFVSAYSNRVLFHRDMDVSLEDLVADPPKYWAINDHFRPQYYFLGTDPSYYTHIFRVSQIGEIADMVSSLVGRPIVPVRMQTGGTDLKPELTDDQFARVKEAYREDYDVFGDRF